LYSELGGERSEGEKTDLGSAGWTFYRDASAYAFLVGQGTRKKEEGATEGGIFQPSLEGLGVGKLI